MLPDRSDEVDKLLFMNSMEHTVVKNGKLISLSWLKTVTLPKITLTVTLTLSNTLSNFQHLSMEFSAKTDVMENIQMDMTRQGHPVHHRF